MRKLISPCSSATSAFTRTGDPRSDLAALFKNPVSSERWLKTWQAFSKSSGHAEKMKAVNPILIPRNHRIEQAIQAAYDENFTPFNRLADALANPFDENPEYSDLEAAPLPNERVQNTFCGT